MVNKTDTAHLHWKIENYSNHEYFESYYKGKKRGLKTEIYSNLVGWKRLSDNQSWDAGVSRRG